MSMRLRLPAVATAFFLSETAAAFAHDGAALTGQTAWTAWDITPDITIPTILITLIYIAGMVRRYRGQRHEAQRNEAQRGEPRREGHAAGVPWWRHALFFGGLASIFLSLQSPIDPVAERLFFIHQVQHLLLRMMGPMLLMLSWPEALLIAGMPAKLRRHVVAPVISNNVVRSVFGLLAHPVINTAMFIAALYIWEIPRYHNIALRNDGIHYVMHVTMLLAGLIFWWRIFDRRSPRLAIDLDDEEQSGWRNFFRLNRNYGVNYGARLMMLWLVMLSNIILGAYTALKSAVLYGAYDDAGRLFGIRPLMDEQIGGIIIWIPGSMMCMLAILVIVYALLRYDTRLHERRLLPANSNAAALLYPTTGAALIRQARPKNRAMAFGFAVFVFSIFTGTILIAVFDRHPVAGAGMQAGDGVVWHASGEAPQPVLR